MGILDDLPPSTWELAWREQQAEIERERSEQEAELKAVEAADPYRKIPEIEYEQGSRRAAHVIWEWMYEHHRDWLVDAMVDYGEYIYLVKYDRFVKIGRGKAARVDHWQRAGWDVVMTWTGRVKAYSETIEQEAMTWLEWRGGRAITRYEMPPGGPSGWTETRLFRTLPDFSGLIYRIDRARGIAPQRWHSSLWRGLKNDALGRAAYDDGYDLAGDIFRDPTAMRRWFEDLYWENQP